MRDTHLLRVGWRNICKLPWFLRESSVSCYFLCYSCLGRRLQSALFPDFFSALAEFDQNVLADYHFTFFLPYYLEGTDNAQKTPRGHPDFNSYVQNLRVFIFRMDGRMDGRTETIIRGGFPHFVPPGKHLTWRNRRLPSPTRINLEEP
jgi:hypothetical protein